MDNNSQHGDRPDRTARRRRGGLTALALVAGLGLSGAAVMGYSSAAYQASTSNQNNNWKTGDLSLDKSVSLPLFSATGQNVANMGDQPIVPGAGFTRDIEITYTGTNPANVVLSAVKGTDTSTLAAHTTVVIKEGGAPVHTALLSDLIANPKTLPWSPTGKSPTAEKMVYSITITVSPSAPNNASITGVDFTWSASAKNTHV